MKKLIRLFGKLIAAILVLVFIISALVSILLVAVNTKVFSPDFYLEAFEQVGLLERLPALAAGQIKYAMEFNPCQEDPAQCEDSMPAAEIDQAQEGQPEAEAAGGESPEVSPPDQQGGPPSYFQALSENDWQMLLEGLLPPEWMEDQVLAITGGLFAAIDQGYGQIAIKISLKDLKDRLAGEAGLTAIAQLLDAQPECSQEDLLQMTRVLQGRTEALGDFLNCQPPEDFLVNYSLQLEVLLRRSLRDVPDEIDLGQGLFGDDGSPGTATVKLFGSRIPALALVKWIRWVINISPLLCLTLLFVIAFFGAHSFKALGSWWGYPLAVSGLLGLGFSLLVGSAVDFFTQSYLLKQDFMGFSQDLVDAATDLAVEVIHSLFLQVRNFSLVVIGMGLAVIIIAAVVGTPRRGSLREEAEQPGLAADQPLPDPDQGEDEPGESEKEGSPSGGDADGQSLGGDAPEDPARSQDEV